MSVKTMIKKDNLGFILISAGMLVFLGSMASLDFMIGLASWVPSDCFV